jgi:hypothetical protein
MWIVQIMRKRCRKPEGKEEKNAIAGGRRKPHVPVTRPIGVGQGERGARLPSDGEKNVDKERLTVKGSSRRWRLLLAVTQMEKKKRRQGAAEE